MNATPRRTIVHVDMDAFFASVEQVLRAELRGKPVIVGGRAEDRSVVASASYEARAYGVRTGMPTAEAHRRCPEGVFLRGTYAQYREFSRRVQVILGRFAPVVQKASIDDFYLDLTGCKRLHGPALPAAEGLKERIRRETGLNASIGIGTNRLIAKIAGERAKPNGIIEVRPGYESAFMRGMDVDVIPGVGSHTLEALRRLNLRRIEDLARIDPALLEATFGSRGACLAAHARGEDNSTLDTDSVPRSISRETTFERDIDDRTFLGAMLYYLTERAARHLRAIGMQARTVSVKVRYSDFKTLTRARSLTLATDQEDILYEVVATSMRRLLDRRMRVRLIGVALSHLHPVREYQGDLWNQAAEEKKRRLHDSLDRVRDRFGFSIITAGPALRLLHELEHDREGFLLRTSCLSR